MTLLIILLVLVGVIAVVAVIAALQPARFRIERSTVIAAPPAAVFAEIDELARWNAWSPWAKRDPRMVQTHEGPARGVGAIQRWTGNREVGSGSMTIIESAPPSLLRIRLEFLAPFKAVNTAEFTCLADGAGARVTWAMHGERVFATKAACLFMDMDKMVGGDFATGLASLKRICEAKAAQPQAPSSGVSA